jgi:hypothetical protein
MGRCWFCGDEIPDEQAARLNHERDRQRLERELRAAARLTPRELAARLVKNDGHVIAPEGEQTDGP